MSSIVPASKCLFDELPLCAVDGTQEIVDFCDKLQPYLVLRVRGHAASWLVKTRARPLKISGVRPAATAASALNELVGPCAGPGEFPPVDDQIFGPYRATSKKSCKISNVPAA